MGEVQTFSQLGIGIATLAILYLVVKYFIEAMNKKDVYIQELVSNFNKTMNNHIVHETAQAKKQTKALDNFTKKQTEALFGLTKAMDTLVKKIEVKGNINV